MVLEDSFAIFSLTHCRPETPKWVSLTIVMIISTSKRHSVTAVTIGNGVILNTFSVSATSKKAFDHMPTA